MGYGGRPCRAARCRWTGRWTGGLTAGLWQAGIPEPRVRCDIGGEAAAADALPRAVRRGRRSATGPLDVASLSLLPWRNTAPFWTRFDARRASGAQRLHLTFCNPDSELQLADQPGILSADCQPVHQ